MLFIMCKLHRIQNCTDWPLTPDKFSSGERLIFGQATQSLDSDVNPYFESWINKFSQLHNTKSSFIRKIVQCQTRYIFLTETLQHKHASFNSEKHNPVVLGIVFGTHHFNDLHVYFIMALNSERTFWHLNDYIWEEYHTSKSPNVTILPIYAIENTRQEKWSTYI